MDPELYEDWIRPLGEEYPAAIRVEGIRIPLEYETRFKRHYILRTPTSEGHHDVSRFLDGSASITLPQLKQEWVSWSDDDQRDFCDSIRELDILEQLDLVAIIRWLLDNACCAALGSVVLALPRSEYFSPQETFEILVRVLQRAPPEDTSAIRALAATKHPKAQSVIRQRLQMLLARPDVWRDASFFNDVALSAAWCLSSLMHVGVAPAEFEDLARRLSAHPCANNRGWFQRNFAKYYNWMPPSNWPNWPRQTNVPV